MIIILMIILETKHQQHEIQHYAHKTFNLIENQMILFDTQKNKNYWLSRLISHVWHASQHWTAARGFNFQF